MSDERPYEERPAARPINPVTSPETQNFGDVPNKPSSGNQPIKPTNKKGIGCLGWSLIIIAAIVLISVIASAGNGTKSNTVATTDPIEQVQVVLNNAYSYEEISSISSTVISSYGLPATDESISKIWSSVLAVTDGSSVAPMDVMTCARTPADPSFEFPNMVAYCFTALQ
ncbi:hypothetical protein [Aurantimicrobium minutum]|uniref:hypothetical protein n=1 Tax=Aurantimicrobium minutum TaxID=708131 RepID=UPI00248D6252|nr:hypothetical protein [Aurantimicrobium minutum]